MSFRQEKAQLSILMQLLLMIALRSVGTICSHCCGSLLLCYSSSSAWTCARYVAFLLCFFVLASE